MSELLQGSCVTVDGRGVLLIGPPGSGKSSLALALIDRGAMLVGDDGIALEVRGETLWALPPPNIPGKLEIRGIGIAEMPATPAPIALVLDLGAKPPRYVERAESKALCGIVIPHLAFQADHTVAALRAEHALKLHGLPCDTA